MRSPASRPALLLLAACLLGLALPAQAGSKGSCFCITVSKLLPDGVRAYTGGIDSYDWDGSSRPEVINNQVIGGGQTWCTHLEVNKHAHPGFDLTLVYPPSGTELVRDTQRMSICKPVDVNAGFCVNDASKTWEVLDYATVQWGYNNHPHGFSC